MVSHLLPNKASIATLRCLHRVPSHIRTDWFWHPSQHIHNAVLLLGGLGSLLSHNTLSARTFPWTMGTTSIQDYDTLKTRLPTHEFAHKPIDSDKDTEVCAYYTRIWFSCKVNTNFQDAWRLGTGNPWKVAQAVVIQVPSRVGVEVLVKHLSATGADAVKRPKPDDNWFTNNLLPDWTKDECSRRTPW